MPPRRLDLKQVGKLFKDTLAEMVNVAQDFDTLEPVAIEWLRAARLKMMRQIEARRLDNARKQFRVPDWVDPGRGLIVLSDVVAQPLRPYVPAFCDNLRELLTACDFSTFSVTFERYFFMIMVSITFPAQQRIAAHAHGAAAAKLYVDDEFARMAEGTAQQDRKPGAGAFSATNFARLLADETAPPRNAAAGSNKRRRSSRTVKEEGEEEDTRLRSVTRASSAATLRSPSVATRRSGRKKVKTET
ncbi:hypothetical protein C8J57DRAFT_1514045 [Mycena rebaudengoi]|nr:hypothetical protein C8J57DRAFT_1514045 [Mycena rebaudengoi]